MTYWIGGLPLRKLEVDNPQPLNSWPSGVWKTWHLDAIRMPARTAVCSIKSSSFYINEIER